MDPVRLRVAIPAADPPDNITHDPDRACQRGHALMRTIR